MVSDAEREERLRDTVRKRAAWKKRFAWIESERLSTRMKRLAIGDYGKYMEARDVSLDLDGDVSMKDESVRKPTFADRSRRRFRSRMLRVTGRVKEFGLIMEMMDLARQQPPLSKQIMLKVKESMMEGDNRMNHWEHENRTSSPLQILYRLKIETPWRQEQRRHDLYQRTEEFEQMAIYIPSLS